jgi:FlaA1/EpsC-like NDP-sugar epimerase
VVAWLLLEGGRPDGWAPLAVIGGARAAAAQIFRLDRLRRRDWGREDAVLWNAAAGSGSLLGFLTAGALAVELPVAVAVVDALVFVQIGRWGLPGAARPTIAGQAVRKPVLIYGAGRQGRLLLDELRRPGGLFEPIGWLDDDPDKAETVLAGLPVLGTIRALPFLAEVHGVEVVLTAIPGLTAERCEQALEMAEMARVRLYILPTVRDSLQALEAERIAA